MVVSIVLLALAAVLRLVTLGSPGPQGTGLAGAPFWSLIVALMFVALAGVLAWQLFATLRAARQRSPLYRFDPAGAHCFPLHGQPRTIPWENLERIQTTKDALVLRGRSAVGRRAGFMAPLRENGGEQALAVIRHYRPELLTEVPRH